ncbi:L,D-transpeptidase catalytic domain [Sphingomonas laterariae]|uniref:L,D-transpeptidase catalytic domain n=1 Tax=Edaphosphingomonas laterariae TaxID=861865 RepID=A0A239CCU8_9SPHN|nr:L,D-transpeptidase family protein [Sphingomonas laterariae]SNS17173.1 L,D-transpeptidase catalytic domain [Sphingomonas laterariae]
MEANGIIERHDGPGLKRARRLAAAGVAGIAILVFVNEPAPFGAADAVASVMMPEALPSQPIATYRWTPEMAGDLLAEIAAAEGEGLDPAPYAGEAMRRELALTGGSALLDRMADDAALKLARDYLQGRVADRAAFDWHIERKDVDLNQLAIALRRAAEAGQMRPWLRSLLPQDSRYAALRDALAATPASDSAGRDRLRANMERWRWLPRDLGDDHIFVNVPSYTLDLVEDGKAISTYTVVVGKPATPTPQMTMAASSVVVNPSWTVPASIIRSSNLRPGRKGYQFVAAGGGRYVVRQPPGPGNALGRIKIDMPNAHAIYLHDTPAKAYFDKPSRAYSHGCIRVQHIDRLAEEIVRLDNGRTGDLERGLAGRSTTTVKLSTGRPVWLVYFTAETGPDGKVMVLEDPYNRDTRLIARLNGPTQLASR